MSPKKTEKKHGGGGNPVAGHSNPRDPRAQESSKQVQEQDNIEEGRNQMSPTFSQRLNQEVAVDSSGQDVSFNSNLVPESFSLHMGEPGTNPNSPPLSPRNNQELEEAVDSSGQAASISHYANLLSETSGLRIGEESGANLRDEVEELGDIEKKKAEQIKIIKARVNAGRILQDKSKQFKPFWDSLGTEIKKSEFLEIRIQDLRNHLSTTYSQHQDFNSLIETFNQAISYGENNNNCWEFWLCLRCDDKPIFTSNKLHLRHVVDSHGGGEPLDPDFALPSDLSKMLINDRWDPLDLVLALPVIEELTEDCSIEDINSKNWPVLNDGSQRASLLKRIRNMFAQLVRNQCLSSSNVESAMKYAAEALKSLLTEPQQQAHLTKIARSHISICFLTEIDLGLLLQFLESLSKACNSLGDLQDKYGSFHTALNKATKFQVAESIAFSADKSHLLLDERLIADGIQPQKYFLPLPATSASTYPFLSWLFYVGNVSIWEELELWKKLKAENNNLVSEFLEVHEKTGELLRPLFHEIDGEEEMVKAFFRLRALFEAEAERRLQSSYQGKSYSDLLKVRQEEIPGDLSDRENYYDSVAIQWVLENFERGLALQNFGSDSSESRQQRDAVIQNYVDYGIRHHSGKMHEVDSKIMKIGSVKNNLTVQFISLTGLEYRAILLPIIRSFLQGKIEKLALEENNEDTLEKPKDAGADISTASASQSMSQQGLSR